MTYLPAMPDETAKPGPKPGPSYRYELRCTACEACFPPVKTVVKGKPAEVRAKLSAETYATAQEAATAARNVIGHKPWVFSVVTGSDLPVG